MLKNVEILMKGYHHDITLRKKKIKLRKNKIFQRKKKINQRKKKRKSLPKNQFFNIGLFFIIFQKFRLDIILYIYVQKRNIQCAFFAY